MFVKFPKTHWLPLNEPQVRERCLTLEETQKLFSAKVHISEKMDGANVGIQYEKGRLILQKRGGFIGTGEHPQYGFFKQWAYERITIFSQIPEGMVLFGEWCYAKHSIHYNYLPDYFFLFDVWFDSCFLSVSKRDELAKKFNLVTVPSVFIGETTMDNIPKFIRKSHYSDETMEGVVVRNDFTEVEDPIKGKYVRPNFIVGDVHWGKKPLIKNELIKD